MKVDSIQNHNLRFKAKLNVLGGKHFVSEELNVLKQGADKIGFENDVVELNYANYRDKSIEFHNYKFPDCIKRISCILKARFFPNGEGTGTEIYKESVSGNNYREFWEKEYSAAKKYIDNLAKKYPNERIGISIIDN